MDIPTGWIWFRRLAQLLGTIFFAVTYTACFMIAQPPRPPLRSMIGEPFPPFLLDEGLMCPAVIARGEQATMQLDVVNHSDSTFQYDVSVSVGSTWDMALYGGGGRPDLGQSAEIASRKTGRFSWDINAEVLGVPETVEAQAVAIVARIPNEMYSQDRGMLPWAIRRETQCSIFVIDRSLIWGLTWQQFGPAITILLCINVLCTILLWTITGLMYSRTDINSFGPSAFPGIVVKLLFLTIPVILMGVPVIGLTVDTWLSAMKAYFAVSTASLVITVLAYTVRIRFATPHQDSP